MAGYGATFTFMFTYLRLFTCLLLSLSILRTTERGMVGCKVQVELGGNLKGSRRCLAKVMSAYFSGMATKYHEKLSPFRCLCLRPDLNGHI